MEGYKSPREAWNAIRTSKPDQFEKILNIFYKTHISVLTKKFKVDELNSEEIPMSLYDRLNELYEEKTKTARNKLTRGKYNYTLNSEKEALKYKLLYPLETILANDKRKTISIGGKRTRKRTRQQRDICVNKNTK